MQKIPLPTKVEWEETGTNKGKLVVEPCYAGYGTTLGNALRRVLLSSMPGGAVTAMRIKGVLHEFSTIPGVKEDVVEIILNLKQLRLHIMSDEPVKLELKGKGEKVLTAGDFEPNAQVKIANPDLRIAQLTDKSVSFEMEIWADKGRGFVPTETREKEKAEVGVIAIDSIYTPIRNVGYKVENVRVGQMTNYDRLILEVETDGTLTPRDALTQSTDILIDHFSLFNEGGLKMMKERQFEIAKLEKEVGTQSTVPEVESQPAVPAQAAPEPAMTMPETETQEAPKKKRGRPKKS